MIETSKMFMTQVFLLCLILVGVITVKVRIVDEHARLSLSDLVINIFLPCTILSAFFGTDSSALPSFGIVLTISLGILTLSFFLSQLFYFKAGPKQKKVLLYATLISMATFLGTPVVESIYGLEGLPYVAAYLVPLRVAVWTLGIAIFAGGKSSLKKILLHPCMAATYLGLLVMVTGFTPPALVSRLISSLGSCTTPVSMLVIGNIIAFSDPRKLFCGWTIYYTFVRLVFIPILAMGILFIIRPDPMIAGISVILSGMPAAVTTSLLADKYNGDKELASKIIFVSTLLSIFTAPLLAWLVMNYL
jgi:predicted permease